MRLNLAKWLWKRGWFRLAALIHSGVTVWAVSAASFNTTTTKSYGRISNSGEHCKT